MTQARDWASLENEFSSDGQYRYVEVENATKADWQGVFDLLDRQGGLISFAVNGVQEPIPQDASRLLEYSSISSVEARIEIEGVSYDWCIDVPTVLSFALRRVIRNATEFASMCRFVVSLNVATGKSVEINLEGASAIGRFNDGGGFVWFSGGEGAA